MSEQNKNAWAEQDSAEKTNAIQEDLQAQLRMFGQSVADGVANGFADGGYAVGKDAVGVGEAFLKTAAQQCQKAAQKRWGTPAPKLPSASFQKMVSDRNAVGVLQIVFGAVFGLTCLLASLICILVGALVGGNEGLTTLITGVALAPVGLPLSIMFLVGLSNEKFTKRLKAYLECFAQNENMQIVTIAEETGYASATVKKDLCKIKKNNWCPLWVEEKRGAVHLTLASYREATAQQHVQSTANAQASTPAQQSLLEQIDSFILVLGKQTQLMQEPDAVAELTRMQATCRDIYDWIASHPESEQKLRRFTSYYMPTTLKLLYSYNDVQDQQGENAQNIRRDIGRFLHTLNAAFDNLHDGLLSSVSFDVSAEIAALQGILAQDGLAPDGGLSF